MEVRLAENGCDFCDSARAAAWRYHAHDIAISPGTLSQGAWYACDECHDLIEQGDRTGLHHHAVAVLTIKLAAQGISAKQLRHGIRRTHDKFYAARFGKAVRL